MLQPREREGKRRDALRSATRFVRVREATGMVRSACVAVSASATTELSSSIESLCREAPNEAFDFAVDVLTNAAQTMSTLADENGVCVSEIESNGERLDRLNDENKRRLAELMLG